MPNSILPIDLAAQQADLDKKAQLAAALSGQAMTPQQGQMVSGHYISPGILGAISPMVQAFLANKVQGDVTAGKTDLNAKYKDQLGNALNSYLTTRNGQTGAMTDQQASDLLNNDQAPTLPNYVAPDPRKAAVQAVTSGFAPLQEIGQSDLQNSGKGALTQKDILGLTGYDPKSRIAAALSGVIGNLRPETQVHTVGNNLVTGTPDAGFNSSYDGSDEWGPVIRVGTDSQGKPLMGQKSANTGEIRFAPGGGQTINVDTQGNKEALQQTGQVLKSARDDILTARTNRGTATRVLQLLNDPQVQTGFGSNVGTGISALGAKLGFNGPDSAAKTQSLAAELAKGVLANAAALKPLSDSDVKFLKEVESGTADLTKEHLQHAMGLVLAASHNATMDAMDQYHSAATVHGAGEITKLYPLPPIGSYKLDPRYFEETGNNRFTFKSPLLGQQTPVTPTPGKIIKFEDM